MSSPESRWEAQLKAAKGEEKSEGTWNSAAGRRTVTKARSSEQFRLIALTAAEKTK